MSENLAEKARNLGKKSVQAAVPAVMFLGSVFPGPKVGEARQVSDAVSRSAVLTRSSDFDILSILCY